MRSVEGDVQSGNLRGQRSRAPRLSPELTELMHMLELARESFRRPDRGQRTLIGRRSAYGPSGLSLHFH